MYSIRYDARERIKNALVTSCFLLMKIPAVRMSSTPILKKICAHDPGITCNRISAPAIISTGTIHTTNRIKIFFGVSMVIVSQVVMILKIIIKIRRISKSSSSPKNTRSKHVKERVSAERIATLRSPGCCSKFLQRSAKKCRPAP